MSKPKRTTDQIKSDLAANRAKLTLSVEELVDEMQPKNVAKRAADEAKTFVTGEIKDLKSQFKDENGWRTDRLVAVGGAVVGAVVFVLTVRGVVGASRRRALRAAVRKELAAGVPVVVVDAS